MINIDLDNLNEEVVYKAFQMDGKGSDALNDSYLELFELIGRDAMLKLFKYFRGDKIDCPMKLRQNKSTKSEDVKCLLSADQNQQYLIYNNRWKFVDLFA